MKQLVALILSVASILGSDNGVISVHLRRAGGNWASADLTEEAVGSIRSLVADDVHLVSGDRLPFSDAEFDLVVIVDMLEHVEDDVVFAKELARILKPNGRLVINAPNLKPYSPLRAFRHLIGQTDEAHGHLRPGYDRRALEALFSANFQFETTKSYSRFFSELIDTAIVFAYSLLSGGGGHNKEEVSKGLLMTEEKLKKMEKSFKLYSLIYPLVKFVSFGDLLIPFIPGFMRISVLSRKN